MLFASASSHMCLSLLKTHLRKLRTAIALLLTTLLAVAGYVVQNKNAADANEKRGKRRRSSNSSASR